MLCFKFFIGVIYLLACGLDIDFERLLERITTLKKIRKCDLSGCSSFACNPVYEFSQWSIVGNLLQQPARIVIQFLFSSEG